METEVTVTETVEINPVAIALEVARELLSDAMDKGYLTFKGGKYPRFVFTKVDLSGKSAAQADEWVSDANFLLNGLRKEIARTLVDAGMERDLVTELVRVPQARAYIKNGRAYVTPPSLFINDTETCRRRLAQSGNSIAL